jgi:PAT family beta-lactamase induction signal transducer AmpG
VSFGRWGRRRPLLLFCEAAMALTLIALAGADPQVEHGLFLTLVFINSFVAALQDVATDALAISLLPEEERGRANGVMSAAKYAGMLVGGSGLAVLAARVTGWPASHFIAAALLLVPATAVLLAREPPAPARPPFPHAVRALAHDLFVSFVRRSTLVVVAFALVSGCSDTFLYPFVMAQLRKTLSLSEGRMALLASFATATSIVGALLGGWAADALGRRRAILAGALGLAASHLLFAAVTPSWQALTIYQVGSGLAAGVLYASTLAFCMDLTNPRLPATHFQFYMAVLNVRMTWASFAGGRLGERLPTMSMFVLAALLELAPLGLLVWIDPHRTAQAFRRENADGTPEDAAL